MLKGLISRIFGEEAEPEMDFDEEDRESFLIVAGAFEINEGSEQEDWRSAFGLSKDAKFPGLAVARILNRYDGTYF